MQRLSEKFGLLKATFNGFLDDECATMAAALAFYTAISLPPLLVLLLAIAGFWDPEGVEGVIRHQTTEVIGRRGWDQVETMMKAAQEEQRAGIAAALSIAMLLFGATGVMVQLQAALNKAWEVEPDPDQGTVRNFILKRLLSIAMIMGIAFVLIVSLALTAVLQTASGWIKGFLPEPTSGLLPYAIDVSVSLIVYTGLFAAMFKWLPDAETTWRDVWIGGITTALLFMLGKLGLSLYFELQGGGPYGGASAFVLILLWVYYSSMILLLGAEFTQSWARSRGRQITPVDGAVRVVRHVERMNPST